MRFGAIAGPQGPAGSPFVPTGVLVYTEADLPPPVANVITLQVGVVYQFMDTVTLTAGRRVVAPPGCAVVGAAALACKLVGDVDAALLTVSGAAGTVRLDGLSVTNTNAGASAKAIDLASAGATLIAINVLAQATRAALTVSASANLFAFLSAFTSTAGDPVDVVLGVAGSLLQCSTIGVAAGAKHFRLRAGAAIETLSIENHGFVAYGANQRGVVDEGATISRRVVLEQTQNDGPSAGTFLPNDGWNQGTPNWYARDCEGLPDSSAIGGAHTSGAFVVPIAAAGAWTPIAPAVGTPWLLEADSERFTLASSANGTITYSGGKPRRFLVVADVVASKSGSTVEAAVAIFVDGVLHAESTGRGDVTTRRGTLATAPCIVLLSAGSTLDVRVQNVDNDQDFTISEAAFCANVSSIS